MISKIRTRLSNRKSASMKGMTLFETLLVFTMFAAAIGAGILLFNSAQSTQKVTNANAAVASMANGMKELYYGQSSYSDLNTAVAIRSGKVPGEFQVRGTLIENKWGGNVVLTGNSSDFEIEVNGLNHETCMNLSAAITLTPGLIYGLTINSNPQITTPKVSPGTALSNCSTTGLNTLTYSVR